MRPVILMTAGLEDTKKGIRQIHMYKNYAEAISEGGGLPLLITSDREEELQQLTRLADGLFLTGGEDVGPEYYEQADRGRCGKIDAWRDAMEMKLCRLFLEKGKPILGVCRGLQLLNVCLGGTLVQDILADTGIVHAYGAVHEAEAREGSWFSEQYGKKFMVNSYHHQTLGCLGNGLVPVCTSEQGVLVEAVEHESLPVFAVQWHPERMTGSRRYDGEGPDMSMLFERFCSRCRKGEIS